MDLSSPIVPTCTRSSNGSPRLRNRRAQCSTSGRCRCTSSSRAAVRVAWLAPSAVSSTNSSALRRLLASNRPGGTSRGSGAEPSAGVSVISGIRQLPAPGTPDSMVSLTANRPPEASASASVAMVLSTCQAKESYSGPSGDEALTATSTVSRPGARK